MRVLVLGGSGFIGAHVVERLLAAGHDVTSFQRGNFTSSAGIPVIRGDRNRLEGSAHALRRVRADVVVDGIGFTRTQAESLVATFRGHAERVVVLSSGDVYHAYDLLRRLVEGEPEATPLRESARLRDRMFPYRGVPVPQKYGFSWDEYEKILVERTVMGDSGLPATVLRLPMVYGPGVRDAGQRRFFPYLKRMEDGRPAILFDERTARWRAPWGYAADMAEAVRLAVESHRAAGEIFNVCEAESLDTQSWVRELAGSEGWDGEMVTVNSPCPPPSFPEKLNLAQHLDMDSKKIRRLLGYCETVPRSKALERTVAWEREHWPAEADPAQFDYVAEDAILRRYRM